MSGSWVSGAAADADQFARRPRGRDAALVATLLVIAMVAAVIGSLGAPLITAVAEDYHVSLAAAQWTLTISLLSGAVVTPLLGRLGSYRQHRRVVLATLAIVVAGSIATAVPAPFAVLLLGRGAQGIGLGLTALMIATARQHLGVRAPGTIAMLSVASTIGIGLGYPAAGWLTQASGVRAAYLFGLAIAVAALLTAVVALPPDPASAARDESVDWLGAVLLSLGLVAVLLVSSDTALWAEGPLMAALVLTAGMTVLIGWAAVEQRVRRPLVDVRALRHPAVAGANLVMAVSGIAMYLLFTLITRFVQTPPDAGYGYGLTDFQAGLVLIPFSVMGLLAGRLVSRLNRRAGPGTLLSASGVLLAVACALFATTRSLGVAWPIAAMGVLGLAVGGFSATMPQTILTVTPAEETAAAMSVNQVVRSVGFSLGSAFSALALAAHTPVGRFTPTGQGYTTTAWAGAAVSVASIALAAGIGARQRRQNGSDRRDAVA